MGITAVHMVQGIAPLRVLDPHEIFEPFRPRGRELLPSRIIRLFASSKIPFEQKYRELLPKGIVLSKRLEEILGRLKTPVSKSRFPDFLRCLGAVCQKAFIGPKRMLFDISYGCNLDCVYCRRHSAINPGEAELAAPSKESSFLPLEYLIQVLDDAKKLLVEEILLVGGGEPTIHPQFEQIIREVKSRGFGLNFSTNGLVLRKKLVDTIVEYGVDNITVSVSGVSFDSYKKTHPMMSRSGFEKLFKNFEYLNHKRRKVVRETGVEFVKPFTLFLHVITRDNYYELMDMVFSGAEYGFDTIWLKLIHPSSWSRHLCLTPEQADEVKRMCRELRELQPQLKIKIDEYLDSEIDNLDLKGDWSGYFHEQRRCFVGWNFSYIDLSKDVSFCCGDKIIGLQRKFGSFYEFWISDEYNRARSCARNYNYGGGNLDTYNGGEIIDDFCKSCDNTNFNNEMERLVKDYGLSDLL